MATATNRVTAPMATKLPRQPILSLSRASGQEAVYAPSPPTAMSMPVIRANSSILNQLVITFMVGTNSMATPNPTSVRARIASPIDSTIPKKMEEAPAMAKKTVMVLRGPQESESRPEGSCIKA